MKHKKIVFRLELQIAVNGKNALETNFLLNLGIDLIVWV